MKAYNASHPPRDRREYKKKYDAEHKDKSVAYREANKEKLKAMKAEWYLANKEKVLERVKKRAKENKEQISAYHAAHYEKNAERIKSYVKSYRKENPDKKAQLENRRRVRKKGNGGSHTLEEWKLKCEEFNNLCAYCGLSGKPLTRDHVIPLSKGGSDNISNIMPACRSCNSRKNFGPVSRVAKHFEQE